MLTKERAREILVRRGNRWLNSPKRFREYFEHALILLTKKGWCQGAYARSRHGFALTSGKDRNAASFCASGALERVTPEQKEFGVCQMLLTAALGCGQGRGWSIASVNDDLSVTSETARQRVLDGYRSTIAILDELV